MSHEEHGKFGVALGRNKDGETSLLLRPTWGVNVGGGRFLYTALCTIIPKNQILQT
jgi:hypothetical protein